MRDILAGDDPDILEDVRRTYRLDANLKRVEKVLDPKSGLDPAKVFRSHEEKTGDVIEQPDISYRVALDRLLGGLSALHIGGLNSSPFRRLESPRMERVGRVLSDEAARAYYVENYPYAPPVVFLEDLNGALPGAYAGQWLEELSRPAFQRRYRRFLHLDARFIANDVMGEFIDLLDDYGVRGDYVYDLRWALEKPERLKKWLKKRSRFRLLDGMQGFFAFAGDLDTFLAAHEEWPVFRGAVWLHFAYWFGTGGDRMLEVAQWLEAAAGRAEDADSFESAAGVQQALARLRDASLYPREILRMLDRPLAEWKVHADLTESKEIELIIRQPIT